MLRWIVLVLVAGLVAVVPASAATRETKAVVAVSPAGTGKFTLTVSNWSQTTVITAFQFVAGPALSVTAVDSTDNGTCQMGTGGFSCAVTLGTAPCDCMPGGGVNVLFSGSGDTGGSQVRIDDVVYTIGTAPATPPQTTPPTAPPKTTKLSARVGPGAKIVFASKAPAGKATVTVRDMTASDNFHLSGPGVNKKTGVRFKGTVTWTVALRKGVYTFRSDAHAKLSGKTVVG
jgi:hypothetical protein